MGKKGKFKKKEEEVVEELIEVAVEEVVKVEVLSPELIAKEEFKEIDLTRDSKKNADKTLLVKKTIRSGQSINFDGSVVVLGDVNPGGEIVATGNIIVMGCLRGVAHAGAMGDENSIVTAFKLKPTQLRIANHITRSPDGDLGEPNAPEIAKIKEGIVIIESYPVLNDRQIRVC